MAKANIGNEHTATAKATSLHVSTKHSIEISRALRYKTVAFAKDYLESVIEKEKAIPFRRFNSNVGHKAGMAAGRYPVKAAKEFLTLMKSVESNAQDKGLASDLKIIKIISNRASIPFTGGRNRTSTKRTHLEVEVKELSKPAKKGTRKTEKSAKKETAPKKETVEKEAVTEVLTEETVKEAEVVEEDAQ